jgi:hypothetical protein
VHLGVSLLSNRKRLDQCIHQETHRRLADPLALVADRELFFLLLRLAHVPAKWNPVRRQGHAPTRELAALSGHIGYPVIHYDRKAL